MIDAGACKAARHGRRRPYTVRGIRRLPCFRCGEPAEHQWQVCADGSLYRPLCIACDIALNELVLRWMGFPNWQEMIERYKKQEAIDAS